MRIVSFRIVNYKSFANSEELCFEPGFNVIVGRNNVGKTALAEAVSLRFSDKPHRSLKTVPTSDTQANPLSRAEVSTRVVADELAEVLANELPTFYASTDPNRSDAGEDWLRTVLSDGANIKCVFS